MIRTLRVARREFVSTVCTKGFIVGIAVLPAILLAMVVLLPLLMNEKSPKVDGTLAVVDRSGQALPLIEANMTPKRIAEREGAAGEVLEQFNQQLKEKVGQGAPEGTLAAAAQLSELPTIVVEPLDPDADVEVAKDSLLEGSATDGSRLAVAVVSDNAITANEEGEFGTYELFIRENLDDRIEGNHLRPVLRDAIRNARLTAAGYDPDTIDTLTRVPRVRSTTVTEEGEQATNEAMRIFIPLAFMMLLMVAVMTGGSYLMTTTIEEKSSRVVEVLLAAVSPKELMTGKVIGQLGVGLLLMVAVMTGGSYLMTTTIEEKSSRVVEVLLAAVSPKELMTGKVIGQLGVGLLLMMVYSGLGIGALSAFSKLSYLDPLEIVYLMIFFLLAYFMIGSFMAAVGAAVNELREAQALQTPVMMVVMIPWLLWLPISRDPNAPWAVALSMIPPVNSFAMLLRITSATTEPVPTWQILTSIGLGIVGVYFAIWFCAKIFRVGILLHGTPPTFRTLVKWVRMA
ncbi:MAG: ABC transporter permease [Planctomycetota bacterium]